MRLYTTHTIGAVTAVALAAAMIACDNRTLRVTAPDVVQPGALGTPGALPTVTNAVYGDFGYAFGGDGGDDEGVIQLGGLLGDEWHSSDTFPTRNQIDDRAALVDNGQVESIFRRLQRARSTAQFAVQQYQKFKPGDPLEAEAYSFVGYATLLLGENYCTGIPFSSVSPTGVITYGPLESSDEIWHDARAKFDSALTILGATGDATEIAFASIGKARALLDSGDFAGAAAAVDPATVPDDFVFNQGYAASPTRVNNGVWEYAQNEGRYSVADSEGGVGLGYRSANDPRVPWVDAGGTGFDNVTELFLQLKDSTRTTPIPIATGSEARLIEAEAALAASNNVLFLSKINQARQDVGDTAIVSAVPAGLTAVQFLFQERAFDLWITAHRLGDMRRLMRQYSFTANEVFPNGTYPKGGPYGNQVALPLPIAELGNPNYKACDATIP